MFVADGKGGHQRLVPVADVFFTTLAGYLSNERPSEAIDDHVFVVLKGPNRDRPLSAAGLDEVLAGARGRAGLTHASCHELRHTCFTRLREAGMARKAIQAQAPHASIETTRVSLHLSTTGSPGSTSGRWPSSMACTRRNREQPRDSRPLSVGPGSGQTRSRCPARSSPRGCPPA